MTNELCFFMCVLFLWNLLNACVALLLFHVSVRPKNSKNLPLQTSEQSTFARADESTDDDDSRAEDRHQLST